MTDFLKIAKSIVVYFAHICAYGVETVNNNQMLCSGISNEVYVEFLSQITQENKGKKLKIQCSFSSMLFLFLFMSPCSL